MVHTCSFFAIKNEFLIQDQVQMLGAMVHHEEETASVYLLPFRNVQKPFHPRAPHRVEGAHWL